ncbi:MAG TPA: trehalose-phosphatase [Elusimicrobia bacterium]|nr:trehalose-phosphatase [Elusimicrobiota bacterium]HBT61786.1 trehalose-phosphatase [Elusimicrobiota bacterium]
MAAPVPSLRRLARAAAARRRVLILLDFDGTLCELKARPAKARLSRSRRASLSALLAGRIRLAVLSGRPIMQLKAMLKLPRAIYGGNFGLRIEGPGLEFIHPQARRQRPALSRLARRLARLCSGTPGVMVEDKGASLSVHYRGVLPRYARRLRRLLAQARRESPRGFAWQRGQNAWEILPTGSWDKGSAARWLWRRLGRPYLLAIGDAGSDEAMFKAASSRGAAVRVGREVRRSAAAHRVAGVAQVYGFLRLLAREVRADLRRRTGSWRVRG